MPVDRGHRGVRRRETLFPARFVNDDRHRRGRSPQQRQRPRMGQVAEEPSSSSVIMLSSAENTLVPNEESSLLMSGRRSTRLTDVDMVLDETGVSVQGLRDDSGSFASDGTNMSVINVDQTTMIERERAKSSVLPRWTRSKSCAPAGAGEEAPADGIRRSSIFSMVTKRNRRRARSVVRSSIQEEVVRSKSTPGERNEDSGQGGMELSKISEEQANSSTSSGNVPSTPKVFVPELVIQTRSMLKKGKRWNPNQSGTKSPKVDQSTKTTTEKKKTDQNKRSRTRKQKGATSETPKELGKEAQSKNNTPIVPSVTRRKRKEPNPKSQILEKAPVNVDANQNVSSASKDQVLPEADKSVATSGLESSSDQSKSNPGDNSQFSNISKRKRPKPAPDKDPDPPKDASEPKSVKKRGRARSVSKARQPTQQSENPTENVGRIRTRSVSRPRQVPPEKVIPTEMSEKSAQSRGRSRARKRAISELEQAVPIEPTGTRRGRSKSVLRADATGPKPAASTAKPAKTPSRSKSVPRNVLSPIVKDSVQPETDKSITTSGLETSSDRSKSNPGENSPFSNVSKRKRPKPIPDKDPGPSIESTTTTEVEVADAPAPEPEPTVKRARTRSVSRPRQVAPEKVNVTAKEPENSTQPRGRGRARKRAISESVQTESTATRRGRSKSALRTEATKPAKPAKPVKTPSRSKSVPRGILSPPPRTTPSHSTTTDHIPIYRRYAEQVLQLNRSSTQQPRRRPDPVSTLASADDDVYKFDSPSQSSTTSSNSDDGKPKTKTKGSTAKKRPRLGTSVSSRSRKTPVKHHHSVFGTDMMKICSVVKKIGGGPVRRVAEGGGTPMSQNVVSTSTLAAMVQPLQPSNIQNIAPRSPSPAVSIQEMPADDHHHYDHEDNEENIPTMEPPTPLSPPRLNPQVQRVIQTQQQPVPVLHTPDKPEAPRISTLNFSPQASSSPWRVQNENILPKTFYFSRSKDLLPSYESDLVVRDENQQPTVVTPHDIPPASMEPVQPRRTSPTRQQHSFVRPTTVPPPKVSSAVYKDIQKSYEQLKATSEMSEKLISAMRKYKSNVHNQTSASLGDETTAEELIARFRMYEENMKKTYQKLQQWYKRSQRTLNESMKAIEQTSSVPKTSAQQAVVDSFRRDSHRFRTMINDLESAMNDSNIENISPPKTTTTGNSSSNRPPFKDIILTERNRSDPNRSPLKTLDITNIPPRFSPVKSPLVKASFTSFSANRSMLPSKSRERFSKLSLVKASHISNEAESSMAAAPTPTEKSVIEIADTVVEHPTAVNETSIQQPEKDLFGFEMDVDQEEEEADTEVHSVDPTPVKITRETLKERLQSVRKLLPAPSRIGSASKSATTIQTRTRQPTQRIFGSPKRALRPIQNVFSASTPLAEKRNQQPKPPGEQDPDISAIPATTTVPTMEADQEEESAAAAKPQESPPAAVFDEPEQMFASASLASSANRTYSRVPRRHVRHKPNIYLAKLGISDDEDIEEVESDSDDWTEPTGKRKRRKKTNKERAPKQKRKKKTVEQTPEFQNFVSEFNSMCDQVNQYQLVIEEPNIPQPV